MEVKFLDLKKINNSFETEFQREFTSFLNSGSYILGDQLSGFEKAFATYCGTKYCIGVGNGLDALTLILKGYIEIGQLKLNDEVLVPANTFIATILSVLQAGLTPVLVEPNEITFNVDANEISIRLTSKTKAIIVTHLYGQLAPMENINKLTKEKGLLLITDAAQAHGASINNTRAGSLADAAAFSFYPSKNLGALGDCGAVTTSNKALTDCIKKLRNYGTSGKYINTRIGVNSRLDELQASFLLQKLPLLDECNNKRRAIAKRYLNEIKNTEIQLPFWDGTDNHVFYVFVVSVKNRKHFTNFLNKQSIGFVIHYPIPPHKQEALKNVFKNEHYPITDKISEEVVSIPLNQALTDIEVSYIIDTLNAYKCSI